MKTIPRLLTSALYLLIGMFMLQSAPAATASTFGASSGVTANADDDDEEEEEEGEEEDDDDGEEEGEHKD
ncbi:hypothetical protein [Lacipirellula sp.]|uniref:hypothetical protein n=1 Tax=Lacipirellula sp. TaxID=2691419 RepID=UPI003D13B5F4